MVLKSNLNWLSHPPSIYLWYAHLMSDFHTCTLKLYNSMHNIDHIKLYNSTPRWVDHAWTTNQPIDQFIYPEPSIREFCLALIVSMCVVWLEYKTARDVSWRDRLYALPCELRLNELDAKLKILGVFKSCTLQNSSNNLSNYRAQMKTVRHPAFTTPVCSSILTLVI